MTVDAQIIQNASDKVSAQANSGDKTAAAHNELNQFKSQVKDPKDYSDFLNQFQQKFGGNSFQLHAIQLVGEAAQANDPVRSDNYTGDAQSKRWQDAKVGSATRADDVAALNTLGQNNDELYKMLDTYAQRHGTSSDVADGQVTKEDLQAFLADANNPSAPTAASEYLKVHQGADQVLGKMLNRLQGSDVSYSRTQLLNELGYSGDNAEQDYEREHPAIAVSTEGPNGRPDTIVTADGTSRGLHYDASGAIDAINKTLPNGDSLKYVRNSDGSWVDQDGKPAGFTAPFIDNNGKYGYYTQDANDQTKWTKSQIDLSTGQVSTAPVDLSDPSVAVEGLNRPLSLQEGVQSKIGGLDVVGVNRSQNPNAQDVQGGYQIVSGDNLYQISRRILGVQPGQADPPELTGVVSRIAQANGLTDPNMINADSQLIVPADVIPPQAGEPHATSDQPALGDVAAPTNPEQNPNLIGPAAQVPEQNPDSTGPAPQASEQNPGLIGPAPQASEQNPGLIGPAPQVPEQSVTVPGDAVPQNSDPATSLAPTDSTQAANPALDTGAPQPFDPMQLVEPTGNLPGPPEQVEPAGPTDNTAPVDQQPIAPSNG